MKNYLIAAFAMVIMASSSAQAADTVKKLPELPVLPPPAFSWSGVYLGGMLGGAWGVGKSKPRCGKGASFCDKLKPNGFIGGVYGGYNRQFSNNLVLGLDTDFLWGSDVKDSGGFKHCPGGRCIAGSSSYNIPETASAMPAAAGGAPKQMRLEEEWIGGTRLRAGYALGRVMPYLAGGVSYAKLKASMRSGDSVTRGKSKTRTGWNIGVGADFIPPIMHDHLALRAEYRYSDFGKKDYDFGDAQKYRVKYNQNDFRVGVAYKF